MKLRKFENEYVTTTSQKRKIAFIFQPVKD